MSTLNLKAEQTPSEEGIETTWWKFVNSHPRHALIFRGQNSGPTALGYLRRKLEAVSEAKNGELDPKDLSNAFEDAPRFVVSRSLFGKTVIRKQQSRVLEQSRRLQRRVEAARLPKKVSFLGCRYELRDQHQLKEILNLCAPAMEEFDIQCDQRLWTPWLIEALGNLDQAPNELRILNISGVNFCLVDAHLRDLLVSPNTPQLSVLNLSNCPMDCQAAQMLGCGVRDSFIGIQTLSLNNCELGDGELGALVDAMFSGQFAYLHRLNIPNNKFTVQALPGMARLLSVLTELGHLDLSGNKCLFERSATTEEHDDEAILKELELMEPFHEAVRTHPCLKKLLLVNVGLDSASTARCLESLGQGNPKLETLRLDGNSLRDTGGWLKPLAHVNGLRSLGLPSTLSLEFVLEALEQNHSLYELHYFWQSKVDIQNLLLRNRTMACRDSLPLALWPKLISAVKQKFFVRSRRTSIFEFVQDNFQFWAISKRRTT